MEEPHEECDCGEDYNQCEVSLDGGGAEDEAELGVGVRSGDEVGGKDGI